jgi:hypothetical protein
MRWVTRTGIRVNRTATIWLIRRFVDPTAEIAFVHADHVAAAQADGAIGFDAPGARYPHRDEQNRCSFEALIDEHAAGDAALRAMARIVHGADFNEDTTPESAGLALISRGFPAVARDDHDTAARAAILYDALYAALTERAGR